MKLYKRVGLGELICHDTTTGEYSRVRDDGSLKLKRASSEAVRLSQTAVVHAAATSESQVLARARDTSDFDRWLSALDALDGMVRRIVGGLAPGLRGIVASYRAALQDLESPPHGSSEMMCRFVDKDNHDAIDQFNRSAIHEAQISDVAMALDRAGRNDLATVYEQQARKLVIAAVAALRAEAKRKLSGPVIDAGGRIVQRSFPTPARPSAPRTVSSDAPGPATFVASPIPQGHQVTAQDLGRGLRVVESDEHGVWPTTHFSPQAMKGAVRRLAVPIAEAMHELSHWEERTGYPLGLLARQVKSQSPGTCDGEICAALRGLHDAGHVEGTPLPRDRMSELTDAPGGISPSWPIGGGKAYKPELASLWINGSAYHHWRPANGQTPLQLAGKLRTVYPANPARSTRM